MKKELDMMKSLRHNHICSLFASLEDTKNLEAVHVVIDPWGEVLPMLVSRRTNWVLVQFIDYVKNYAVAGAALAGATKRREFMLGTMTCLLSGVEYLHRQNLRHGDLKLQNIIFTGFVFGFSADLS